MTTPFQQAALERLVKAPCTEDQSMQNWGTVGDLFGQILAAPFVFNSNLDIGDSNDIVAYQEQNLLVAGPLMWAVAMEIVKVPEAANDWVGLVRGKRARDAHGRDPEVDARLFILKGRDGASYTLNEGDVFGYLFDTAGRRVVVMDPINSAGGAGDTIIVNGETVMTVSREFWCRAQANWSVSGYVSVKLLEDGHAGGTEVGSAFNAYFRGDTTAGRKHYDPNVVVGQDIRCAIDTDGAIIVTDAQAYDLPIGTVVGAIKDPVTGTYAREYTKGGWGAGDGTGNSSAKGGSGINWQEYYLYAKSVSRPTPGDVSGGSDLVAAGTHTHSNSLTIGSNTTGYTFSISDHPNHEHEVGCATTTNLVAGGGSTYLGLINLVHQHTGGAFYTGGMLGFDDGMGTHTHDPMDGYEHSVTPSDPGHTHSVGGSLGNSHSDPAKFRLYWIERLDNSVEAGGA